MSPSAVLYFIEPLFNRSANKSNFSLNLPARFARRVPDEPQNQKTPRRRRQGRRATANPRPSLDAIRALYAQVRRNPEAALCLGGLLEDLECSLDNRPRHAPKTAPLGGLPDDGRLFDCLIVRLQRPMRQRD